MSTQNSQLREVKSYFGKPNSYLDRRGFDIRIRAETVQALTRGRRFEHALDIGCGDGSISQLVLPRCRALTALDISPAMLALARKKLPADAGIRFLNENFMDSPLDEGAYDLVLCLGVLAHVDAPEEVIAKIGRVLKPGGILLLEVTDSGHPLGWALDLYHGVLKAFRPEMYEPHHLRNDDVLRMCAANGLQASACFRYALPPPGSHRLFSQDGLYRMTRALFGTAECNRNRRLGNLFIHHLQKVDSAKRIDSPAMRREIR